MAGRVTHHLKLVAEGIGVGVFLLSAVLLGQKPATPAFENDILPIFKANCLMCHSGRAPQAGLDLSSPALLLKGGKSGKVIQPGSSEGSLLLEKVASGAMPPGETKLSKPEIELLRQWVEKGAPVEAGGLPMARKDETQHLTENDVLPIFQMRCVLCHGKRRQEGGLDLRTQASRLKGGKSGPALVPGKPDESLLIRRIVSGEMPPPKMLFDRDPGLRSQTRDRLNGEHYHLEF